MKYKILLIILFFGFGFGSFANEQIRAGLFFSSHEVIKDKRTSLNLTPEKPFVLKNGFTLEFNVQFRQGGYGFISRIIADKDKNIDLITNLAASSNNFSLVIKDNVLFSFDFSEIPNSAFGEWINIKLEIAPDKSTVSLSFNGIKKEKMLEEAADFHKFDFVFGALDNPKFLNTDVPPMTLKDIVIKQNGKIFRNWKLSKHAVNAVYDEIDGAGANVKNGTWLIDKHLKWEEKQDVEVLDLKGIAKNEQDGLVYLIDKLRILVYNVATGKTDTIKYAGGFPFNNYYDCFIYNPQTGKLLSYDLTDKQFNYFDFNTKKWQYADFAYKEPDFAHHNKIFSPVDGSLLAFGGYGHYRYKSQISHNGIAENTPAKIYPRYLSAAGVSGDEWLIFGGYGSKSGRQEVSPEFFYDLHSYNFKTRKIKKIRDYTAPAAPFVPCEALIVSGKSFYTLVYNNTNFKSSLRLAEFFMDSTDNAYTFFPDSIPYNFSDIGSWATLFLDKKTSQLIAVTNYKSDVKIYSLAYPPLSNADVIQNPSQKSATKYIIIIVGVLLIIGIFIFKRKRVNNKDVPYFQNMEHLKKEEEEEILLPQIEIPKRKSKASIYFLGGFQVFDKEGNDISALFSPTLKQLFIIILLYMVKNGRGISTVKLNETLWFDKTDSSARNNRNVSISKLRTLIAKIGEMDIVQESAYWRVQMEGVYSDYVEAMSICEKMRKKNATMTETEAIRFVQIVQKGEMLPNMRFDWIDEFKADFSNNVIDTLLKIAALPEFSPNNRLIIHVADAIFKYDSINEDAIALKCAALCRLGKKGLAKTVYESFAKEYKMLLGTAFNVSFNELIV
ncbi:MAG: hypothetical protein LBN27_13005 [Prevotellaceae bacterium]|jgi:two-component SAPR family response regulator|nr:hypothetical protein [Prevotellaceae bacterium]